jgi:head-tail adaptor
MSIRSFTDGRRLDQRVDFERNTPTRSSSGDSVDSWRAIARQVHAAVDGAKASAIEPQVAGEIMSQADYTIWVRADIITRFAITVADRVVWKGRAMNIKDIPDQQLRGRFMAVICIAGVNAG